MDDIFIIKPPSAPTIQQKNTMWPTEKIEPKVSRTGQPQTSPIEWEIVDNEQLFVRNLPLLSHHLQNH